MASDNRFWSYLLWLLGALVTSHEVACRHGASGVSRNYSGRAKSQWMAFVSSDTLDYLFGRDFLWARGDDATDFRICWDNVRGHRHPPFFGGHRLRGPLVAGPRIHRKLKMPLE